MKILLIEQNKEHSLKLKKEIEYRFDFPVTVIHTKNELKKTNIHDFDLIISEIFTEEFDEEYIKKTLISQNVPLILVTDYLDANLIAYFKGLKIVDLIIKSYNHFTNLLHKIEILAYLKEKAILIVNDSSNETSINVSLLKTSYPYTEVCTAKDGQEAIKKLEEHSNIKLILTNYNLPKLDATKLIKTIRENYDLNEKIIITLNEVTEKYLSSSLIKIGANDFLYKPFLEEELMCRIDNNIKNAILIDKIKNMAFKDPLTNIYNRRYFFEVAEKMFLTAKREKKDISILMCDIDHFKKINDTYGHHNGDIVIKTVANLLTEKLRKNDIVARYGGEEFIVLLYDCPIEYSEMVGEKIRKEIEKIELFDEETNQSIKFTMSVGISNKGDKLISMIKNADEMLYKAKETRNRVVVDQ